jgi:two-component system, NarL family, nitrate/nitrite response regulator NarL
MDQLSASIIGRNEIACHGLAQVLAASGFQVLHAIVPGSEPWAEGWRDDPAHLVIVDREAARDALDTCAALRAAMPRVRLVLLCDDFELDAASAAFNIGVDGLLTTEIAPDILASELRMVAMGESVMPSRLVPMLTSGKAAPTLPITTGTQRIANLTRRETEILHWLAAGHPNKTIAGRLGVSEATVKAHIKAILRKQNFKSRTQAAIWAYKRLGEEDTHVQKGPV